MIPSADEVCTAALALNASDRAIRAQQLLKSLDEQQAEMSQAEIDQA